MEGAFYLYEKGVGEEVQHSYLQLAQGLEEYVGKMFNDWVVTVDKELGHHLETQLMSSCHNRPGMIEDTFSHTLRRLFGEMRFWERLRFEVPHYATGTYKMCEDLRVLRENVLLVVRDYNSIVGSLQPQERALFRERIRSLDKKLRPGMTKLTWASDGILEYVSDCRTHAHKVSYDQSGYSHYCLPPRSVVS